ncbi:anaphase-promoting complex subunit 11 [Anaeramoeba ignava]|uniref:Anaphase-promoting complex subunit 11 n=1 Tax=Anaeramoeba ignava TaxID=1746090 RepID=A0A9Q0LR35_ANAIG|nr:anaphase-promoting complex subunit 11 [Anaeramoeba ignava]
MEEKKSNLIVTIKKWHTVSSWTWGAGDDNCGICQMPLDGCAPECQFPGDDCPIVWGKCGHKFHLVCINTWIQRNINEPTCPMCREPWEFRDD